MTSSGTERAGGEVDPGRVVALDLETTAIGRIRDIVRALLAPDASVVVEDAVLVVDELVANAHAHGTVPRRCRLLLAPAAKQLRVEVDDTAAADPVVRRPDATGGRGMLIIERLAIAWGVRRYRGFKTVWAELPLDRPVQPVGASV